MERKEILLNDLYNIFEPKDTISTDGDKSKWYSMTYKNEYFSGTFVSSMLSDPSDVIYCDPALSGWYKIFVAFPGMGNCTLSIKLTDDEHYSNIKTVDAFYFKELLWKCADMTNQKVILSKKSTLAALRFVPMSDEEVENYKQRAEYKNTRHLYVADDMGHGFSANTPISKWLSVVDYYTNSDAEWYSWECCDFAPDDSFYIELHTAISNRAHELGLKVSVSNRMGNWGVGFPHVLMGYGDKFTDANPDFHCVDRNGDVVSSLSYAYLEVRKHKIDIFVKNVRLGADAVNLLACRGLPFVLFEKPVADRFYEKYGEYPYDRPLDDPKLNDIHCEIMEDYLRELRDALDNEFGKDKIKIHIRGLNAICDMKYLGLDVERLAQKGLVDVVLTHPRRYYEYNLDDILTDGDEPRIDMEKYDEHILKNKTFDLVTNSRALLTPYKNSRGELVGPATFEEWVNEWEQFSKKYDVPVYYDITDFCYNDEGIKYILRQFHELGIDRLTIFNTPVYVRNALVWSIARKACHIGIADDDKASSEIYTRTRVHTVGDCYYNRYLPIWGG